MSTNLMWRPAKLLCCKFCSVFFLTCLKSYYQRLRIILYIQEVAFVFVVLFVFATQIFLVES